MIFLELTEEEAEALLHLLEWAEEAGDEALDPNERAAKIKLERAIAQR